MAKSVTEAMRALIGPSLAIAFLAPHTAHAAAEDHDPADFAQVIEGQTFTTSQTLQGSTWNNTMLRNCHFIGCASDGLLLRDVSNVVITGCTFEDIEGQAAIRLSVTGSTEDVTIDDNLIRNVQQNGISAGQRSSDGVDHRNLRIIDNTIDTSGLGSGYGGYTHHIYVQAQDATIAGNRLYGTRDGNAISIRSSGMVQGNLITGTSLGGGKSAIRYYSDHMRGASNTLLIENNMLDNGAGASELLRIYEPAAHYDGASDHIVETFIIRFNTIISRHAAYAPIIIGGSYDSPPYMVQLTANLLVSTGGAPPVSGPTTTSTANLSATDMSGFVGEDDPHITWDHPAVGSASNVTDIPTFDIDGQSRAVGTTDVGADQLPRRRILITSDHPEPAFELLDPPASMTDDTTGPQTIFEGLPPPIDHRILSVPTGTD